MLSGLLLNVALYALLRFKILLAANPAAIAPGPLMVTMGLVSLVFAAFMLYRRRDIKRLFAYSSIEHMGIIVFAFGMGGPLANFAGLLHMVMHSLTKSAIFYAVGHISQIKGTQRIAEIRGLTVTHPALGWGLVVGVVAIAGLPPLGIFMSEFLVVSSTFARQPLLAIVLVFGLLLAFGALMLRLTSVAFGEPRGSTASAEASYVPMFAHLALVFCAGNLSARAARRLVPARRATSWIVGDDGYAVADRSDAGRPQGPASTARGRAPWSMHAVWKFAASELARWALEPARPLGRAVDACTWRSCDERDRGGRGRQPGLSRSPLSFGRRSTTRPRCGWSAPSTICSGSPPQGLPDTRPWLDHDRWGMRFPLRRSHRRMPDDRRPIASCPCTATACIRLRSVRCMRESSSPDISALPRAARPWSGWRSGWDMPTRASRG